MASRAVSTSPGRGIPATVRDLTAAGAADYAARHWGVTERFKRRARQRLQEILDDDSAPRSEWIAAIKAAAVLDGLDARRDRAELDASTLRDRTALDAIRTALAAQLLAANRVEVKPPCPSCAGAGYVQSSGGAFPCPACAPEGRA